MWELLGIKRFHKSQSVVRLVKVSCEHRLITRTMSDVTPDINLFALLFKQET